MTMPLQRPSSTRRLASKGLPSWAILLAGLAVAVVIALLVGGALGL